MSNYNYFNVYDLNKYLHYLINLRNMIHFGGFWNGILFLNPK